MSSSVCNWAPSCASWLSVFQVLCNLRVHLAYHKLISLSSTWRRTWCSCNIRILRPRGASCASDPSQLCHSSFIFFHSSFLPILDTLKFLHHRNSVIFSRLSYSLIDGIPCLSSLFSDCDFEMLIMIEQRMTSLSMASSSLRAISSEIVFLMLDSCDSNVKAICSYPPGPHRASARVFSSAGRFHLYSRWIRHVHGVVKLI